MFAQISDTTIEEIGKATDRFGWEAVMLAAVITAGAFFAYRFGTKLFDIFEKYLTASANSEALTSVAVEKLANALPESARRSETIDEKLARLLRTLKESALIARDLVPENRPEVKQKLDQVIHDLE